jgi:hypothetical protein
MPPIPAVRNDRLSFAGEASWIIQPDRAAGTEAKLCSLKIYVQLRPKTGEVHVSVGLSLCATL